MLKLEIVTPEKRVVDTQVDSVTVPTATGEAGILPSHAPLISALKPGILTYWVKGNSEKLVVSGGFVEVNSDTVAVLADSAETAEEIDSAIARSERDDAERSLSASGASSVEEFEIVRESFDLASARVQLTTNR